MISFGSLADRKNQQLQRVAKTPILKIIPKHSNAVDQMKSLLESIEIPLIAHFVTSENQSVSDETELLLLNMLKSGISRSHEQSVYLKQSVEPEHISFLVDDVEVILLNMGERIRLMNKYFSENRHVMCNNFENLYNTTSVDTMKFADDESIKRIACKLFPDKVDQSFLIISHIQMKNFFKGIGKQMDVQLKLEYLSEHCQCNLFILANDSCLHVGVILFDDLDQSNKTTVS